jgi:peptide deformylase
MLKIVQAPSSVLAEIAKPGEHFDPGLKKLVKEMIVTLEAASDPEGVGLAAPQIGKSLQLFIIKQTPESQVMVCINPTLEILTPYTHEEDPEKAEKKGVKLEGCLSLQDIWGVVHRAPEVKLTYLDEKGTQHSRKFTGFLATIIQHEYDHIHGTLFPKRVLEQNEKLYKAKKDKKGEMVFEEIEI